MMDAVGSFISFLVGVVVAAAVPRKRCQKATPNGLEIQEGQGGRVGIDIVFGRVRSSLLAT